MTKEKAVFLDRDGVVNELIYFQEQGIIDSPFTPGQFILCPGVPLAIKRFQNKGYKVIIVSNQPGIAKGHMTQNNFDRIDANMKAQLGAEGVFLDGVYYCLHHPKAIIEQFRTECDCRKPKPGLILQAARDLDIDISQSWCIGDNLTDIQAGTQAGCHTLLLGKMRCELCELMYREGIKPDAIKLNLFEAVDLIIKRSMK